MARIESIDTIRTYTGDPVESYAPIRNSLSQIWAFGVRAESGNKTAAWVLVKTIDRNLTGAEWGLLIQDLSDSSRAEEDADAIEITFITRLS